MKKELHIYMYQPKDVDCYVSYNNTKRAIDLNESIINTTQIHFCHNKFIYDRGYTIYIHGESGRVVKIDKNGTESTNRRIREEHNLEKLLISGEFGDF